jgi:DNA uptake protein ComE-like DNA-binding protein
MSGAIGDARNIDLNSSSEQELANVGGIGSQRARSIVENRPFRDWEDLKRVEGFSDTLVNDLRQSGATLGSQSRNAA